MFDVLLSKNEKKNKRNIKEYEKKVIDYLKKSKF